MEFFYAVPTLATVHYHKKYGNEARLRCYVEEIGFQAVVLV